MRLLQLRVQVPDVRFDKLQRNMPEMVYYKCNFKFNILLSKHMSFNLVDDFIGTGNLEVPLLPYWGK